MLADFCNCSKISVFDNCMGQYIHCTEELHTHMKITICIGSSCHLKGSRQIVEELQRLVKEHHVADKVELAGQFCMGRCQQGVCVTLDGAFHSLTPETAGDFFRTEVLPRL